MVICRSVVSVERTLQESVCFENWVDGAIEEVLRKKNGIERAIVNKKIRDKKKK